MIVPRFILLMSLSVSVLAQDGTEDPLESLNRKVHGFNEFADSKVLKPAARGYRKVTPRFVRSRIGNVFSNLDDVNNSLNNIFQGKFVYGASDISRLLLNTTIGLGGMFDPASGIGLKKHNEDWGQTFAVWGLPAGPYVVLPFWGPATLRHAVFRPLDATADPLTYLHPVSHRNWLYALRIVDDRESLLDAEKAIFGERYIFLREAYLQRRDYLINDGEVEDPFADDFQAHFEREVFNGMFKNPR